MFEQLNTRHFQQLDLELPEHFASWVEADDFVSIDNEIHRYLSPGGRLFEMFSTLGEVDSVEHLIAIREGENDEDGIWHDDGSRDLAFTISLTKDPDHLEGGQLLFRPKENHDEQVSIPTAPWGTLTVIKTGKEGHEHRVCRVKKGRRIICAGWICFK